jgi:hypothetical protein
MSIWIITTGSSDVQLKIADNWGLLYGKIRSKFGTSKQFSQTKSKDNQRFLYPARAMGLVYGSAIEQHYDDLAFPLLDNFWTLLTEQNITPQRIIVLLTDQTQIFTKPADINNIFSAYWQDTCTLEPLLKRYLAGKSSATPEFLTLKPAGQSGLDNWNDVLEIVQHKLAILTDTPQDTKVYVSHQAGTPAISSAVQFASLAQFGDRVEFLVSSEQDKMLTDTVKGGSYLRGIKKEQAKKLLSRYDYAGVNDLLKDDLNLQTKILLDAAIQWNFAEFSEFKNKLKEHPQFNVAVEDRTKEENWWWMAYESSYLGVVRLKQDNTVEAMFHTFRAVEGLLKTWSDKCYPGELKQTKHPKCKEDEHRNLKAYGQDLYWFLTVKESVDGEKDIRKNKTPDIFIFGTQIFSKRNNLFHNLNGLQGKEKVFENWRSPNEPQWRQCPEEKWKMRVMNCLNFISEQSFLSLESASLMAEVHAELVKAIAQL